MEALLFKKQRFVLSLLLLIFSGHYATLHAQAIENLFEPLEQEWPQPDGYRTASGAPGPQYWQQQADYQIQVTLDEVEKTISGTETITYHNRSPHTLTYLWVQLDQNRWSPHSISQLGSQDGKITRAIMERRLAEGQNPFLGGLTMESVTDGKGSQLSHQVVETNVRLDLPEPLEPGKSTEIAFAWNYPITNAKITGDRAGYEYFPENNNYIFEIAQFYPRMCTYTQDRGWQNQPYINSGEFALEFGDFEVEITVPADHIVAATGTLENQETILTQPQQERLKTILDKNEEVGYVVTPAEARANQLAKATGTKTWKFAAQNVRDFAFASSRKFVWDVAALKIGDEKIQVQSFYPVEGQPLWNTYATHAAMHTLKTCSRLTVDYPYPTCNVVHGAVWGMEYPMLSFCGGRPKKNGDYSYNVKYSMLGVVMHEVGHNFFPMIVNSDERRWAWMDEGLNSFIIYVTEQEFEPGFPSRRGLPAKFAPSMSSIQNPIMTNPESLLSNAAVSYEKTATALNILRETVIGREGFDRAFKEYATRWAFKHPEPADFFRTMEEVSGVDLDWFWRCWFYGVEPVDIGIVSVVRHEPIEDGTPLMTGPSPYRDGLSVERYQESGESYVKTHPQLADDYDPARLMEAETGEPVSYPSIYLIEFEKIGGCVSPIIFRVTFTDGTEEVFRLPAEAWVKGKSSFRKEVVTLKTIKQVELDPFWETADVNLENNLYPQRIRSKRVKLY